MCSPAHLSGYMHTHAGPRSVWPLVLRVWTLFAGTAWQQNDISVNSWWVGVGERDGWMDGWHPYPSPVGRGSPYQNTTGKGQSKNNVFLDIKSLPVGLWTASPTIFSRLLSAQFIQPFSRQRYWSSFFSCVCKNPACSCRYVSQMSQITLQ